ncbi:MAG: PQQ-like beta-propeller repeat protein [Campylobacter sp.]|nr:PQQ-like beta-propeller repeat protein [Campylobacter sp.]
MKKTLLLLTTTFCLIFLSACSTKREYFNPSDEEITGKISFSGKSSDDIVRANSFVATLADGSAISIKSGEVNLGLSETQTLLNETEGKYSITDINGTFTIKDESGRILFDRQFPTKAASASTYGDLLAVLSAENAFYLFRISNGALISAHPADDYIANDARVAAPIFFDQFVAFPTLDGKIYVVDQTYGAIVGNFLVSNQPFLNNIIFFKANGDKMYAASGSRLMLIDQARTQMINDDIKVIDEFNGKFYIFSNDGSARVYDSNLNLLNSNKFKFAIFSNVIINQNGVYILEKTGYIIKTDLNLQNPQIFEIDDEVDDRTFASKDKFYIGDKFIKID